MTTVYLIRHAETDGSFGPGDAPISAVGRQQAQAAAAYLAAHDLAQLCCSPLRRAIQTADIIATHLARPVTIDPRLRERMNWGDLVGQSRSAFAAMWERCSREPAFSPLPGVSAQAAAERLASFLLEIHQGDPPGSVAAITHGGIITDFLHHTFSRPQLTAVHPGFATAYDPGLANGSMTIIRVVQGCFELDSFGCNGHLL